MIFNWNQAERQYLGIQKTDNQIRHQNNFKYKTKISFNRIIRESCLCNQWSQQLKIINSLSTFNLYSWRDVLYLFLDF